MKKEKKIRPSPGDKNLKNIQTSRMRKKKKKDKRQSQKRGVQEIDL